MTASQSSRITVTEDGAIRYYWRMWGSFFFTLVLALSFMAMFVYMTANSLVIPQCFTFITLLLGLGLSYITIGFAINYTEFQVESGELLVCHKPLPWRGNQIIPLPKIDKINIKLNIQYSEEDGRSAIGYDVVANPPKPSKELMGLLLNLSLENADALAWELENMLGKSHYPDREKRIAKLKAKMIEFNSKPNR